MITRISKIARLPKTIRDQLNQRLENGEIGRSILPWLNSLPETKKVLAELFSGKSITHQNLSEWRRAGYQDWLFQQQRLQWFDRMSEQETEIAAHDGCGDTYEAMGNFFLFEIGQAMAALQTIKNPHDRWNRLREMAREFARLQNAYNWSRRVALEWDKFNDDPASAETTPTPEPAQSVTEDDDEDDEEYYTDEDEENETAAHEEIAKENSSEPLEVPPSHQLTDAPAEATLGAPPSRRQDDLVNSIASDSKTAENPNPQTAFHPIPTPAPTTPPSPIFAIPITPPRKYISPNPIRGRRFTCIEG